MSGRAILALPVADGGDGFSLADSRSLPGSAALEELWLRFGIAMPRCGLTLVLIGAGMLAG